MGLISRVSSRTYRNLTMFRLSRTALQALAKPKRPQSAYLAYCQVKRPEAKKANPKVIRSAEMMKILGGMWANESQAVKTPYERKAAADLEAYRQKVTVYKESLPAKIKKGRNPFIIFSSENRPAVMKANPGARQAEVMSILGQKYKKISAKEKARFEAQAKQEAAAYVQAKAQAAE